MGFPSGAASMETQCRGVNVSACLSCVEGRDVLCSYVGVASVPAPEDGFRIASARRVAALAWVSQGHPWFLTVDETLEAHVASPPPPLDVTGDHALAPSATGWLFAFANARGVHVAALGDDGQVRGAVVHVPTAFPAGAEEVPAELDLVDVGEGAILVIHRPGAGTAMHRVAADATLSSPGDVPLARLPLHGHDARGVRVMITAYRSDGARPRAGDVLVAWAGRSAVAYGTWNGDGLPGGLGTIEGTSALDVTLPDPARGGLTLCMAPDATGTLDVLAPGRGALRRFHVDRATPAGLFIPAGAPGPRVLDVTAARVPSLRGTLTVALLPSFVPSPGTSEDAVDLGAQLVLALSGPRRGVLGVRERLRRGRRRPR
jgi:hypothetical protein